MATELIASENELKSTLVSRNVTIFGKRTSVRLEPEMWKSLHEIARREGCSIHDVCSLISMRKQPGTSLTAAIRVFVMLYFKAAATEQGHLRAGHGDFEMMKRRARVPEEQAGVLGAKKRSSNGNFDMPPSLAEMESASRPAQSKQFL